MRSEARQNIHLSELSEVCIRAESAHSANKAQKLGLAPDLKGERTKVSPGTARSRESRCELTKEGESEMEFQSEKRLCCRDTSSSFRPRPIAQFASYRSIAGQSDGQLRRCRLVTTERASGRCIPSDCFLAASQSVHNPSQSTTPACSKSRPRPPKNISQLVASLQ